MELRRSSPKDARHIAALEAEIFSDPWCERDIADLISTEGSMCYTATDGDEVIAYILGRLVAPEGEIYRLATAPQHRRRGIGYRMLSYAYKTELGRGLESLFLEVRERNLPARALYSSFGFKEAGFRRNYYKNPTDNAVIMLLSSEKSER